MTHDELITISTQELEKLPADEREIIVRHFGTGDPAELAALVGDAAQKDESRLIAAAVVARDPLRREFAAAVVVAEVALLGVLDDAVTAPRA